MRIVRPAFAAFAICAILCGTNALLQADEGKPPLYLVLFRLTVGEDNGLQDFQVEKVIDLLSGSNNAVLIELPKAFIDQARRKVEDQHFKPTMRDGRAASTLTTFIYSPADENRQLAGISFGAFNGAMNTVAEFRLLGQDAAVSTFGADFGTSACFVGYYAVPLPKARKDQRQAIVEAELQRCAANVQGAKILSHKDLSTDSQTIMEFTAKSPENKALTIRTRYICNDRQMLALTATTPDGLSGEDTRPFDRLFEAFHFP